MQPETPQTQTPSPTPPTQPITPPVLPQAVPTPEAFVQPQLAPEPTQSNFSGMFSRRIGRMGFFLGFVYWDLVLLVPVGAAAALIVMLNGGVPGSLVDFYGSPAANLLAYLFGAVVLLSLPISLSLYIRRLHDLGQSGWWSILSLISPINFFFMLYLLFAKGPQEENQYGKPVKSHAFLAVLGFGKPRE